jgi:3-hydroxyanthranilate 3,4-dioxygenase
MNLRVLEKGKPVDVRIREGDIFLLPGKVPHSPQRPAGSVGLVLETKRAPGELDGFLWCCEGCGGRLHEEHFQLEDIVKQLPSLFERFWSDSTKTTCQGCGQKLEKPTGPRIPW